MTDQSNSEERDVDSMIKDGLWDEVASRLRAQPEEARKISDPMLGYTKLHLLCSMGCSPRYLIEMVAALYPEAIAMPDNRFGDTPLHMLARNSITSSSKMNVLLGHLKDSPEGILIRNRFGGTVLHSASNHNAVLAVLKELVTTNPQVLRVTTHDGIHAVSALYHAYIQTIPGNMAVARTLKGDVVEREHFVRFWKKLEFLSSEYFRLTPASPANVTDTTGYVLHGLIQCFVHVNVFRLALKKNPDLARSVDSAGNLPLHLLVENRPFRLKEKQAIVALLDAYPKAASACNNNGDTPLLIAIRNKIPWENGVGDIVRASAHTVQVRDPKTGLLPFQFAASVGGKVAVNTTFSLLSVQPDLLV